MMRVLVFLVLSICSTVAFSYEGEPLDQVKTFFSDYSKGKSSEAIDRLFSSNPMMNQKPQELTMLKQQVSTIEVLYGKYLGTENIHYEELTPSLVRIVQLAKHEKHPVIWEFFFYKPKKEWIISQGIFVDTFQVIGKAK